MQHKRGICLGCGSEVAVRGDDHLFRHSSQRGEICPKSYSIEWEPLNAGDPGPDTVPPQYRTKLAEEIRSMIPPPWAGASARGNTKAQEWHEVADFVERTGEWKGWDL
jgi:hypothetical protein